MLQAGWQLRSAWRLRWRSPSRWPALCQRIEASLCFRFGGWMSRTRPCWATSLARKTAWVDSSTWSLPPPRRTPQPSSSAGWASVTRAATHASLTCIRPAQSKHRPASLLLVSRTKTSPQFRCTSLTRMGVVRPHTVLTQLPWKIQSDSISRVGFGAFTATVRRNWIYRGKSQSHILWSHASYETQRHSSRERITKMSSLIYVWLQQESFS